MKAVTEGVVGAVRSAGKALEIAGRAFEKSAYVETLQPSLRSVALSGTTPSVSGFVAPTASVVGKVQIGDDSSIWYGAVMRGDVNTISVGKGVTIGDRAMVHCSGVNGDYPCVIGDNVIIGAGAIVHGCTVESGSMIGEGAQVMDGAKVQKNAVVAPGALVSAGKTVPAGQMWGGVPAKMIRELTSAEIASIKTTVAENIEMAKLHSDETAKPWQEIAQDEYDFEQEDGRNNYYYKRLTLSDMQYKEGELENHEVPGRVLDTEVSSRTDLPSAARV